MVKVQQKTFAAVEETKAKKIVVNESRQWPQYDVDDAEADLTLRHDHLRTQRRVAVHVLDVVGERRVGVMKESAGLDSSSDSFDLHILMDRATLEFPSSLTEEAQLWIRPEATMPNPATEEFILPR